MDSDKKDTTADSDTLESQATTVIDAGGSVDATGSGNETVTVAQKPKKQGLVRWFVSHLNIYFLLFLLILVIAGVVIFVSYESSKKQTETKETKVQKLSDEQLKALQSSTTKVGDPKSILNIESNAIFSGKVLIRDSLDVAGTIKVGGPLSLPGISVSGSTVLDDVKINTLSVTGNTAIQGQLTIQKTLGVSGGATFGGPISAPQLNIDNLQISKDLVSNRHIAPGGPTPGLSFGTALGSGGTASNNGTDTAGTMSVNTGGSPAAGCFATITFINKFNTTPHIIITPVGSAAGALSYYTIRSTGSLSICSANAAPASSSFGFDYIALD